jgi:hypothetical protein
MATQADPTCASGCPHYRPDGDGYGTCRRFPPSVASADNPTFPAQPGVLADEVCGEHPEVQVRAANAFRDAEADA